MATDKAPSTTPRLADIWGDDWLYAEFRRNVSTLPAYSGGVMTSGRVASAVVRRGRSAVHETPSPASLTLVCTVPLLPHPGDRVDVLVNSPELTADQAQRFVGEITSVTLSAGADQLVTFDGLPVVRIEAVDQRARVNRFIIPPGSGTWPTETADERAAYLIATAGGYTVGYPFPRTSSRVLNSAASLDGENAGQLIDAIQRWTGDVAILRRDVEWDYYPLGNRGGASPDCTLRAEWVADPVDWTATDDDKVTRATVTYGTADPQDTVEVINPDAEVFGSLGDFLDRRPVTVQTELATAASAEITAEELVGRRSIPRWTITGFVVPLAAVITSPDAGPDETALLVELTGLHGEELLRVEGFPDVAGSPSGAPSPTPNGLLWLLGWTETITGSEWTFDLDVASYGDLADALTWDTVPDDVTWDSAPDHISWVTSPTWQPLNISEGTWHEVPSDLTWNYIPDATTWDDADDL